MQKIKYIKDYQDKKYGQVETVENNHAHTLIDKGVAVLFKYFKEYDNKMMSPEPTKHYKVK
jgi:hypothetical protein